MRIVLALALTVALTVSPYGTAAGQEAPNDRSGGWGDYTDPPAAETEEELIRLIAEKSNGGNSAPAAGVQRDPSLFDQPVETERRWTPPPIERGNGCEVTPGDWAAVECTGTRTAPPPPDAPAGTPGITIRDVASFRPELAVLASEPNGWAVRGLDANVLATGGSSTRTGELFGITAEVRFTPVAYTFDYGDGSAPLNTATPGATWEALGLAEFDPTATSHVYDSAGTYTVTLLVDYAAAYRVGGGAFIPIPGTLAIPSAPIDIVVADSATTALVGRSCRADPSGPGC